MKVAIINCFDTYEERVSQVFNFFSNQNNEVIIIQSDYLHFQKIHRTDQKTNHIFIKSLGYKKNLSVSRLYSHYKYARDSFKAAEKIDPDLIYVLIPPNSLVHFAAKFKKKYENVRLIFDLIDLWPETMPVKKFDKLPVFNMWKNLRDKKIRIADFVITECDLYREVLGNTLDGIKVETVYLAKSDIQVETDQKMNDKEIHLCYLGSINNIIDIDSIKSLVSSIHTLKSVVFHIIGDGESKEQLIYEIEKINVKVEYHGIIYDVQQKQDIFDKCQFGINIMKESVCVGLTMKSIDYFQHGLPILNNIKRDSVDIVNSYNAGININQYSNSDISRMIASYSLQDFIVMKKNARKVYEELFSVEAFRNKLSEFLKM